VTDCVTSTARTGLFLAVLDDFKSRGFSSGARCGLASCLDTLPWDFMWFQYGPRSVHIPFQGLMRMKMLKQKALLFLLKFLQRVGTWQSM
jgi:hypothetical protein